MLSENAIQQSGLDPSGGDRTILMVSFAVEILGMVCCAFITICSVKEYGSKLMKVVPAVWTICWCVVFLVYVFKLIDLTHLSFSYKDMYLYGFCENANFGIALEHVIGNRAFALIEKVRLAIKEKRPVNKGCILWLFLLPVLAVAVFRLVINNGIF